MTVRTWFVFAHPIGDGRVAVPCESEDEGRARMRAYAYEGATFPDEVPLLGTRVCAREALFRTERPR